MKKKGNRAFTLVELIAVVAILSILLCIAVPNMMNYINAAHEATAQTCRAMDIGSSAGVSGG